jgi:hypothetical protein
MHWLQDEFGLRLRQDALLGNKAHPDFKARHRRWAKRLL